MKASKSNYFSGNIFPALMMLFTILFLQACTQEIKFLTSSVVPAAEGSVKIKKDKNNNYNIEISIIRLAEPERLSPSKSTYVVWIDTDAGIKNIGQLNTSSGFLSKTLKSSLKTVSSFKPTSIFITAEDNANIQYPGTQVVLKTATF